MIVSWRIEKKEEGSVQLAEHEEDISYVSDRDTEEDPDLLVG